MSPDERIEQRVRDALAGATIDATWLDCDPALADTAAFCEHYGIDPAMSANCIVVVGKADPPTYAACSVLAVHRLDVNRAVRAKLGSRKASFASAEETRALTGMEIGGVTPPGLPPAIPLWVDDAVLELDEVIIGGGSRRRKLRLNPADLLALPGAEGARIRQA